MRKKSKVSVLLDKLLADLPPSSHPQAIKTIANYIDERLRRNYVLFGNICGNSLKKQQ